MEKFNHAVYNICYILHKDQCKPKGHIIPSRRIRHGNPLSPYIFLLCAKGILALIQQVMGSGQMEGIVVCRKGPKLSHLFFANDSLIFYKASIAECESL